MKKYQDKYTMLDWDSKLFGYAVAKISETVSGSDLFDVIGYLKEKGVKLIYIIANPSDILKHVNIVQNGGKLVDTKRIYSKKIVVTDTQVTDFPQISPYLEKKANAELHTLAYQSGIHSRFFTDKNFTNDEYRKLYSKWIEKAVLGVSAFEVLVYRNQENQIGGFITLEKDGASGKVGLLAVDHTIRRNQIGSKLLFRAFESFRKHKLKFMNITTQKTNEPACRLYEKHGFSIASEQCIYHVWL